MRELDLAHVELPDPHDVVIGMDDGGRLALRLREDGVDQRVRSGHGLDLLEVVDHHGGVAAVLRGWLRGRSERMFARGRKAPTLKKKLGNRRRLSGRVYGIVWDSSVS